MKWIRKTFVWASAGCLGLAASASAQPGNWRQAAIPLALEPTEVRPTVSLGRPTPIAAEGIRVVNAFAPIATKQPSGVRNAAYQAPPPSVVRGVRPLLEDEPRNLFLPKDLMRLGDLPDPAPLVPLPPVTLPAQAEQPLPKGKTKALDVDVEAPEKIGRPILTSPAVSSEERIIIVDESGRPIDDEMNSLFSFGDGSGSRFYVQGEFLLWTARGFRLPPLVTTASPFDPEVTRGALGSGTTRLLFGDSNTLGGLRPGARFTAGYNLDPCGLCALEGSFFFLSRQNDSATFDSSTTPVIARPFFNVNTGQQDRELTTSPGILAGDVFSGAGNLRINMSTTLFGAELNHRQLLWTDCGFDLTGLVGFRFLSLNDSLNFEENIRLLRDIPGNAPNQPVGRAGDRVLVFDRFDTHNRFYGGQFGLNAEWRRGPWSLDARFKLGLGVTRQEVDIDGGQRINSVDGRVQNFRGGLYALPSNIGHHSQSRFAIVPDVGLKVGYNLTENVRVFVGYDFLYWNSVLRPGDQIDQALDANTIPNSGAPFPAANQVRPRVPFRTTSYWAHGLNAGLEVRY